MNRFDDDRPCTVDELMNIITAPSGGFTMLPSTPYDEVVDNIFIGEGDAALRVNCMKRLKVTHVLNAALGKDKYHVNSNHVMYRKAGIEFLGIEATDFINCKLFKYFDEAVNFIDKGLKNEGKIFVHCVQGVSRSATLVLAYLMIKKHIKVQDAVRMIRAEREICPNDGFLQQLCDLNDRLIKAGHFSTIRSNAVCDSIQQDEVESEGPVASTFVDTHKGYKDCECDSDRKIVIQSTKDVQNKKDECNMSEAFETVSDELETDSTCNVEELENILTEPSNGLMLLPKTSHSQINEHIFIGDASIATNIIGLQTLEITHVLNAAHNKGVNSNAKLYAAHNIGYLGLQLEDTMRFDLTPYIDSAVEFINTAIIKHGRVLVNCVQGASRSASLVIAYFMIKHHLTVQNALRLVRQKREICPNSFFLLQLCDLGNKLQK